MDVYLAGCMCVLGMWFASIEEHKSDPWWFIPLMILLSWFTVGMSLQNMENQNKLKVKEPSGQ